MQSVCSNVSTPDTPSTVDELEADSTPLTFHGYNLTTKISDTLQGSIWRGIHSAKRHPVVIKLTDIDLHSRSSTVRNGVVKKIQENILKEIYVLKELNKDINSLSSTPIIRYIDSFQSGRFMCLVMEDGGHSLYSFVHKAHQLIDCGALDITEYHRVVKIIFKQMVQSVSFIHDRNVCHCDISLENFLINDLHIELADSEECVEHNVKSKTVNMQFAIQDNQSCHIKLCDFGLAQIFADTAAACLTDQHCGKRRYMSPEAINVKKIFDAKANDVYGLAVSLFMMSIGKAPHNSASFDDAAFTSIMSGNMLEMLQTWNRLQYINADIYEVFQGCFQFEHRRMSIAQVKKCKLLL